MKVQWSSCAPMTLGMTPRRPACSVAPDSAVDVADTRGYTFTLFVALTPTTSTRSSLLHFAAWTQIAALAAPAYSCTTLKSNDPLPL